MKILLLTDNRGNLKKAYEIDKKPEISMFASDEKTQYVNKIFYIDESNRRQFVCNIPIHVSFTTHLKLANLLANGKNRKIEVEPIYRFMNHDNCHGREAEFEAFYLWELNNLFDTNYGTVLEATGDDPQYLFSAKDVENWKSE